MLQPRYQWSRPPLDRWSLRSGDDDDDDDDNDDDEDDDNDDNVHNDSGTTWRKGMRQLEYPHGAPPACDLKFEMLDDDHGQLMTMITIN